MHVGQGDKLWNRPFLQLSDIRELDLGLGHMAYRRVALNDLYLHNKFRQNRKNLSWMDLTYGQTLY